MNHNINILSLVHNNMVAGTIQAYRKLQFNIIYYIILGKQVIFAHKIRLYHPMKLLGLFNDPQIHYRTCFVYNVCLYTTFNLKSNPWSGSRTPVFPREPDGGEACCHRNCQSRVESPGAGGEFRRHVANRARWLVQAQEPRPPGTGALCILWYKFINGCSTCRWRNTKQPFVLLRLKTVFFLNCML